MTFKYDGVCYDGPHEGRSYVWDRPYFRVALLRAPSVTSFSRDDFYPLYTNTRKGTYQWSDPLRKWVFNYDLSIRD